MFTLFQKRGPMNSRQANTPNPSQKLVQDLKKAKTKARGQVIRSYDLERSVRERLTSAGYLSRVMNGWYLLTNPTGIGTTTLWWGNYWDFVREYLQERFGQDYCLSAESSLDLYAGNNLIEKQLTVISKKPSNETIQLPHDTSLLLYQNETSFPDRMIQKNGLNILPLVEAMCRVSPSYFSNKAMNMEICLRLIGSASDLSRVLLTYQGSSVANRLIGALHAVKNDVFAKQIEKDLIAAGFLLQPTNPFENQKLLFQSHERITSAHAGRITALWMKMRDDILSIFPKEPGLKNFPDSQQTIRIIEKLYKEDSYNSLSIEGYHVTHELIEKIQKEQQLNLDSNTHESLNKDTLATQGYYASFQEVLKSVKKVLDGEPAGKVFYDDLQNWYRELFKPFVQTGILNPAQLAGYRNHAVYISESRHIPPSWDSILDCMETLEKLLQQEKSAAVRAVLGHFIFVYIHPYMDGNGRIARFLLNLMLISGGYNWTIIHVSERNRYMDALERASVHGDIKPFAEFILSEMNKGK